MVDAIMREIGSHAGKVPTPYRGRENVVCCFGVFTDAMVSQALADDPCPMKVSRP